MLPTEPGIDAPSELERKGFIVIPGPIAGGAWAKLTVAYDAVMSSATAPDLRVGSTSTRVTDVVNRGEEFDALYVFAPLLDACRHVIGRQFKLSSLVARTLRPHMPGQELHVDVRRDSADWPLVGFILMVDEFHPENGATRFVAGSHRLECIPDENDPALACGSAGSLLVFNGSTWHGHSANQTQSPRRSLHGAFIPRDGKSATDFSARMTPETRARLSPQAFELLSL